MQLLQLFLLIWTMGSTSGQSCPWGCVCSSFEVMCAVATRIPDRIPSTVSRISIFASYIPELSSGIFSNLPNLREIEIQSSRIDRIRSCAFDGLKNAKYIKFFGTSIGEVEGNAFRNIENIGLISMQACNVERMQSYAFNGIKNVNNFTLFTQNIGYIDSKAFNDFSNIGQMDFVANNVGKLRSSAFSDFRNVGTLIMEKNSFQTMQCNVAESMMRTVQDFRFAFNGFWCDCRMSWYVALKERSAIGPGNKCYGPDVNKGNDLSTLTAEDFQCIFPPASEEDSGCPLRSVAPPMPAC